MKDRIYMSESIKDVVDKSQFTKEEEISDGIYCKIIIDEYIKMFKIKEFSITKNIRVSLIAPESDVFNMLKSKKITIVSFEKGNNSYFPCYFSRSGERFHLERFIATEKQGKYRCTLKKSYVYSE